MKFVKMHGAGNDFILLNGLEEYIDDYSLIAKMLCDRHFGIGADGIMVAKKSNIADINMLYYNSDGSRGEMCGNGIRCFSKFVFDNRIIEKNVFSVETLGGIKTIWIDNADKIIKSIKVNMGYPIFDTRIIPIETSKPKFIEEELEVDSKKLVLSSLIVGVPHTVIFVEDISAIDINRIGALIETNPIFLKKTNVNFVEVKNRNKINVYTWERGAGRTLACGTGACASVVIGKVINKLDSNVYVQAEGGVIEIELMEDLEIFMKGTAVTVFTGDIEL